MTNKTPSLIRHILTALGMILAALGLGKFTGVIDFTLANLDTAWQAGLTIAGIFTSIYGFFKDSGRFRV